MSIWGEDGYIYQKLPAFIADSLLDVWGKHLFDLWPLQHHLSNSDITPLDKLSFMGKRGMGVRDFLSEVSIFTERESAKILPEGSITLQSLLIVGTSVGGRQPKAILAINRKNGEIRSE